jgi:hypothetical protein
MLTWPRTGAGEVETEEEFPIVLLPQVQTIVAPLPCHTREKRKVEIFHAGSLAAASPDSRQTAAHTGGPEDASKSKAQSAGDNTTWQT